MKKIISSILVVMMFSNIAFAQNVGSSNPLPEELDEFDELTNANVDVKSDVKIPDAEKSLTSLVSEEKTFLQQPEIPENIRQSFEEKDEGYLLEGFQLGAGFGMLGAVNAQLGYRIPRRNSNFWKNRFGFRIDYNSWKPLEKTIEDFLEDNPLKVGDEKFSGMISGTNYGALVDFYPFGNTWFLGNIRLSGGYYTGDFSVKVSMEKQGGLDGEFSFNDIEYKIENATATLKANLESKVKGPYIGVGFDFQILLGLKFYFDAGVVFTNNPKVTTDMEGSADLWVKYSDEVQDMVSDAVAEANANGYSSSEINQYLKEHNIPIQLPDPNDPQTVTSSGYTNVGQIDQNNEYVQQLLKDTKAEYEDNKVLKTITDSNIFPMVKLGLMLRF